MVFCLCCSKPATEFKNDSRSNLEGNNQNPPDQPKPEPKQPSIITDYVLSDWSYRWELDGQSDVKQETWLYRGEPFSGELNAPVSGTNEYGYKGEFINGKREGRHIMLKTRVVAPHHSWEANFKGGLLHGISIVYSHSGHGGKHSDPHNQDGKSSYSTWANGKITYKKSWWSFGLSTSDKPGHYMRLASEFYYDSEERVIKGFVHDRRSGGDFRELKEYNGFYYDNGVRNETIVGGRYIEMINARTGQKNPKFAWSSGDDGGGSWTPFRVYEQYKLSTNREKNTSAFR